MMGFNKKYYFACIVLALILCMAQVNGSGAQTMICLIAFVVVMCLGGMYDYALPVLLFFLPWSPILRTNPNSFSLYTVALMLICAISAIKRYRYFEMYHFTRGIALPIITLISKVIDGNFLSMDYATFMILLFLFPIVKKETLAKRYGLYELVLFFSAGIISAAFCSLKYASYGNIAQYIRVDSYLNIVRRCGFYRDPNFYVAQITAAISGCMVLFTEKDAKKNSLVLGIVLVLLTYCGFLSGSKSFALIAGSMFCIWIVCFLRMKGNLGYKLMAMILISAFAVYILTSSLFAGLIDVIVTRLTSGADINSFTTGRTGLWKTYYDAILNDFKVLLLGTGYTNIYVSGRAPHNTIIQMIYQFGLLGTPLLLSWIWCFFKDARIAIKKSKVPIGLLFILIIGIFVPWMAIDVLYFDEFYLLQVYCIVGIQSICSANDQEQIE